MLQLMINKLFKLFRPFLLNLNSCHCETSKAGLNITLHSLMKHITFNNLEQDVFQSIYDNLQLQVIPYVII